MPSAETDDVGELAGDPIPYVGFRLGREMHGGLAMTALVPVDPVNLVEAEPTKLATHRTATIDDKAFYVRNGA